jgi:predicted nucleotidyltransferase
MLKYFINIYLIRKYFKFKKDEKNIIISFYNMNIIPSILPINLQQYFIKLKNYLDTELYFYGSVIRYDYVKNRSDIDLCIFTDNEQSILNKLKFYLHIQSKDLKKVIKKYEHNKLIVYGYKIKCVIDDIKCEMYVYNEKFKDVLLNEMQAPLKAPFYVNIFLYILKFFYYNIPILSKDTYKTVKNYYINNFIKFDNTLYFVI